MTMLMLLCCAILLNMSLLCPGASAGTAPDNEVTIAYQPFASPSGIVLETVKRDRILKQALAARGVTMRFMPVYKGSDAMAALKKGEIQFTTAGDMSALEIATTIPIQLIGQMKQNYSSVVGLRGQTAHGLKGKRIATVFASTGHFALLKTLASVGLTEQDIKLITMEVNEMPDALREGKIDAFSAWEPIPTLAISRHPELFGTIGRQVSLAYLVVRRSYAEQQPEVTRQVMAALIRSMTWLKKERNLKKAAEWNLAGMVVLTGKPSHTTVAEICRTSTADLAAINYSPHISRAVNSSSTKILSEELNFLIAIGRLPRDVSWERIRAIFSPDVVDQVLRNSRKYSLKQYDYEL